MSAWIRKLIGTIALLALVVFWAPLAQVLLVSASSLGAGLYSVLIGFGWLLPAMPPVWWMARPGSP